MSSLPLPAAQRHVTTSSACGICGTASIDAVRKSSHFHMAAAVDEPLIAAAVLAALPDTLREQQKLFEKTGGVHAAGLVLPRTGSCCACARMWDGTTPWTRSLGAAFRDKQLPLSNTVLQVSGRASFELVQKAAMAGVPMLAAVSAPSSLAVELAHSTGVTLVGFSRGNTLNIYTHPERIS